MTTLHPTYVFDLDDTLIHGHIEPRRPFEDVELLPGRVEALRALRQQGYHIAVLTNQGGVAFGYQTEQQVRDKFNLVAIALGFDNGADIDDGTYLWHNGEPHERTIINLDPHVLRVQVAYHHHKGSLKYGSSAELLRRKPGFWMLQELTLVGYQPVHMVGDRPEDAQCAHGFAVPFTWAKDFFAE